MNSKPSLCVVAIILVNMCLSGVATADVFLLTDGTCVEGTIRTKTDGNFFVTVAGSGKSRNIPKASLHKWLKGKDRRCADTQPSDMPQPAPPPSLTANLSLPSNSEPEPLEKQSPPSAKIQKLIERFGKGAYTSTRPYGYKHCQTCNGRRKVITSVTTRTEIHTTRMGGSWGGGGTTVFSRSILGPHTLRSKHTYKIPHYERCPTCDGLGKHEDSALVKITQKQRRVFKEIGARIVRSLAFPQNQAPVIGGHASLRSFLEHAT